MGAQASQLDFSGLNEVSVSLLAMRESVFEWWICSVNSAIPESQELKDDLLTTELQNFFYEIIDAVNEGPLSPVHTPKESAISLHARQRAKCTAYGPRDLLQELQLFRHALFEVAHANNLHLDARDRAIIARTMDRGALDAMEVFAVAHKEIGETFIACLAHDLRNPLNVANASAQLIQAKSADENVLRLARRVCAKLANIDEMIATLLDAMAVNGRKKLRLNIAPFDMKALIDEVAEEMSLSGNSIISTGDAVRGYWCRSSIKRVVENLLSNAQKYGAPGSLIKVNTESSKEKLVLTFHNEGPPIPEAERYRLFSAFHRLTDVDIKGWGLGLPLVQLVVESHGGTVDVASSTSQGTTFTIQLPISCQILSADSTAS